MTDLEKLLTWLKTYPGFTQEVTVSVDYTDGVPGSCGVFPLGLEEIDRQTDVLGNVKIHCRYTFALHRVTTGQQDETENAAWLLGFQNWVQQQSAAAKTPRFGDVPEREAMRAQKGKLKEASQTGTGVYVVTLTADFIKIYEVNENGEN